MASAQLWVWFTEQCLAWSWQHVGRVLWLWPDSWFVVELTMHVMHFLHDKERKFCSCSAAQRCYYHSSVLLISFFSFPIPFHNHWKPIQRERSYIATVWDTSHKHSGERLFQVLSGWVGKKLVLIYTDCHEYLRIVKVQHKPIFFGSISCWWWKKYMHFLCMCNLAPKAAFRAFALLKCCNISTKIAVFLHEN